MRCLFLAVTAVAIRVHDEVTLEPTGGKPYSGPYRYLNDFETVTKHFNASHLGCYCRKVSSVKDCPDDSDKTSKYVVQPEGLRFFHPEVSPESSTHLCCKLSGTAWYDRKGFGYKRQETYERCFEERRPVEDACCRIGKEAQVAVRVKQITTYGKSFPYISVNDIVSATDYDGSALSIEQVKEVLQKIEVAKDMISCSKRASEMIADQDSCRVRPGECCCLQPTVLPAQRCLSAAGATTVGPLVVNGSYTEHKDRYTGKLIGSISWPKTPEELEDLPHLLQSQDPEAADGLEYDWSRATAQWNFTCHAKQKVAFLQHIDTQVRAIYHQEWKTECISMEFNRICPEGQGLYVKQIPLGTCTKVPGPNNSDQLQLVGLGSGPMFQCPDGYQSGTKGAMKSNAHCHCDGC